MTTARVFNLQRFAVHDGPGIRTTVFLQGCPLRCSWCHNPEGIDFQPVVAGIPGLCIGCSSCVEVCPEHIARRLDQEPESLAHRNGCIRCGRCAEACSAGARVVFGEDYTVDELIGELEKDQLFYEESGGGITFSGGEPLAKANRAFLLDSLKACGERGLHRAVDTSGYCSTETLLDTAGHCELFLFDLKLMDPAAHQRHTGVDNARILQNLRVLSEADHDVWVRVPLIPGVNDGTENVEALSDYLGSLPGSHPVYLLPYHAIGGDKYTRIGQPYPFEGETQDTDVVRIAERLRLRGLNVSIGG
jgi:pyruvate formate lyase activating enzyme